MNHPGAGFTFSLFRVKLNKKMGIQNPRSVLSESRLRGVTLRSYCPTRWHSPEPSPGEIDASIIDWGERTKLLARPEAKKTFQALGLDSFVRLVFAPDTEEDLLKLFGKYILWLFLFDDELERISPSKDEQVLDFVEPYVSFLDSGDCEKQENVLFSSFVQLTRELDSWARDPNFLLKWSESHMEYMLRGYLDSVLSESREAVSVRTQISMALWARMFDSNISSIFDLTELQHPDAISLEVRAHPWVREARYLAALSGALFNDVVSYERERSFSLTNIVLVIRRLLGLEELDALRCTVSFQNKLTELFEARTTSIPKEICSPSLERYLETLGRVIYGLGRWQIGSPRYRGCELVYTDKPDIDERFRAELRFLCDAAGFSVI